MSDNNEEQQPAMDMADAQEAVATPEEASVAEMPVGETTVIGLPAVEMPVDETPSGEMPAGNIHPTEAIAQPRMARSASSAMPAAGMPAGAAPANPTPAAPVRSVRRSTPRARRMSLSLTHVSPWSVAKVTFMLMIALAIIQIVAALLVWLLLDVVGVFGQITQIVASAGLEADNFNLNSVFSVTTVLSAVTIFSIIEVVLFTILASIGAMLYNVVASLVGGIHVTLGDD